MPTLGTGLFVGKKLCSEWHRRAADHFTNWTNIAKFSAAPQPVQNKSSKSFPPKLRSKKMSFLGMKLILWKGFCYYYCLQYNIIRKIKQDITFVPCLLVNNKTNFCFSYFFWKLTLLKWQGRNRVLCYPLFNQYEMSLTYPMT